MEMLIRCGLPPASGASGRLRRITSTHLSSQALAPNRARILITSSTADAESLSACEVFQLMLQASQFFCSLRILICKMNLQ